MTLYSIFEKPQEKAAKRRARFAPPVAVADRFSWLAALLPRFARPILIDSITLPADVAENVLPAEQYAKARPVNATLWMDTAKTLGRQWQEQVLSKM